MNASKFLMGLSMLFALGACAAPYGEDSVPEEGSRQETVKSADQSAAIDAARTRVQEDFARAPSLQGHELVVIAKSIVTTPDQIAIQAKVVKRTADGKEIDLDDADFVGVWGADDSRVASPYRSEMMIVVERAKDGNWSSLKKSLMGSRAVEAYVIGQSPEAFEGFSEDFMTNRSRTSRTAFPGQ